MDERLRNFLIKDFKKMPKESMQNFLQMLKHNPDKVTEVISANLLDWSTAAAFQIGGDTLEIQDYQQSFPSVPT